MNHLGRHADHTWDCIDITNAKNNRCAKLRLHYIHCQKQTATGRPHLHKSLESPKNSQHIHVCNVSMQKCNHSPEMYMQRKRRHASLNRKRRDHFFFCACVFVTVTTCYIPAHFTKHMASISIDLLIYLFIRAGTCAYALVRATALASIRNETQLIYEPYASHLFKDLGRFR